MRDWFAARIITGKERIIEWYMKRDDIPVYFPEAQGKRLFPGYAFFHFDVELDWWYSINNTHGVIHLLPVKNEQPLHLPRAKNTGLSFIDDLKLRIAEGNFTIKQAEELALSYLPGQTVAVVGGTHSGCEGELIRYSKSSLILLMAMFNRKVEVSVPRDCVRQSRVA